jgi:hypothetical protein
VDACVEAILGLEQTLLDWSADTLTSDEGDFARASLRSMVVRLGELATVGARDPREAVAPFVEGLLTLRPAPGRPRTSPRPTRSAISSSPPASRSATPPTASPGPSDRPCPYLATRRESWGKAPVRLSGNSVWPGRAVTRPGHTGKGRQANG